MVNTALSFTASLRNDLKAVVDDSIQVNGLADFTAGSWREAICYYLEYVWSNNPAAIPRSQIRFGDIILRLDSQSKRYYVYYVFESPGEKILFDGPDYAWLPVGCNRAEVEHALVQFVKNDQIGMISIDIPRPNASPISFFLWKEADGGYGIAGYNIPSVEGVEKSALQAYREA